MLRARQIGMRQMNRLEEVWRDNPDANLDDVERGAEEEELQPILMK